MILASGASHGFYHVAQLFEWAGVGTNRGRILFHSAQEIVQILFEGRYHLMCGYYSRKYSTYKTVKAMAMWLNDELVVSGSVGMNPVSKVSIKRFLKEI